MVVCYADTAAHLFNSKLFLWLLSGRTHHHSCSIELQLDVFSAVSVTHMLHAEIVVEMRRMFCRCFFFIFFFYYLYLYLFEQLFRCCIYHRNDSCVLSVTRAADIYALQKNIYYYVDMECLLM